MNKLSYVQYGCGWSAPSGWRNFDASLTLRFERLPIIGRLYTKNKARFPKNVAYGDIIKGLPIAPESCRGVYCSHILEHLALDEFRTALKNTYIILRPGGIFRLVLPDLEHYAKQYLNDTSSAAALTFMRATGLGLEKRNRTLHGFALSWLGHSRHLWMWDFKSIESELLRAGFIAVRKAAFGDSSDPMFRRVEDRDRWKNSLQIQCNRVGYQAAIKSKKPDKKNDEQN